MKISLLKLVLLFIVTLSFACGEGDRVVEPTPSNLPELTIQDGRAF